jgi:hypothetical protein
MATTKKKAGGKPETNGGPEQTSRAVCQFFMGKLIEAGYLGKELPEDSPAQHAAAQRLRQMADKLGRQLRKFEGEELTGGE